MTPGPDDDTTAPSPRPPWRLQLLGEPALSGGPDGRPALRLEPRDAAVLARLALDGPQPRLRLAAWLWPQADDARARGNLRQRLFRLRRAGVGELVQGDAMLQLAQPLQHDLDEALARQREQPHWTPPELLAGVVIEDAGECADWLDQTRRRWHARCHQALAEQAEADERAHRLDSALHAAQRLLADDPLEEAAHRRVMRLHYLRGERGAALAAYQRCRTTLQQELGIAPGDDTEALHHLASLASPAPLATPVRPPSVSLSRPPRMVGRQAAWQALLAAVAAQRCVLLTGDAGIGKTRLLSELAATQAGTAWAAARAADLHQPYALLARLLRQPALAPDDLAPPAQAELARLQPEGDRSDDQPFAPARLAWALAALLDAASRRGLRLLILDDLQYADAASLALLLGLAGQTPGTGLAAQRPAWLLAARGSELPRALQAWAEAAPGTDLGAAGAGALVEAEPQRHGQPLRLALQPLSLDDITQLLGTLELPALDSAAWAAALLRHTGGNPLFLLQTLQACLDDGLCEPPAGVPRSPRPLQLPMPPQVGELIGQRLARLGAEAQALAQLAAVAGQDFDAALAAEVLGLPLLALAPPWHALEQAGLLRDEALAHDLILEAVRQRIPAAIRRQLHAQVARALGRRGAAAATLAAHWWAASHWGEAAAAYRDAAARARALSDRSEELRALRRAEAALAHTPPAADRDDRHFELVLPMFHAARYVEDFASQSALCETLGRLARTPPQRARSLEARAMLANDNHQDGAALQAAQDASLLAAACGDTTLALAAVRLQARALTRLARRDEALALMASHREAALALPQHFSAVPVLVDFAAAHIIADRWADALALLGPARERAARAEDWALLQDVLVHTAWALMCADDLAGSTHCYEEAQVLQRRLGAHRAPASIHDMALARQYKELGRWQEALELLLATLQSQERSPDYTLATLTRCELAQLYLRLGQPARAQQTLQAPHAQASPSTHAAWHIARARIGAQGPAEALADLDVALDILRTEGRRYYECVLHCERIPLLPPDEGLALAASLQTLAETHGLVALVAPVWQVHCETALRCGETSAAQALARRLEERLRQRQPAALYLPLGWWTVGRAHAAAGDNTAAQMAWQAGRDWILAHSDETRLPAAFRASFLLGNTVNREVLAAAG